MTEQSTILRHLTHFEDRAGLSLEDLDQINEVIHTSGLMQESLAFAKKFNDMKAGAMHLGINVAKSSVPGEGPFSLRLAAGRLFQVIVYEVNQRGAKDNLINAKLREELKKVRFSVFSKFKKN